MDVAERIEALGPAERIVQTLTTFSDHLVHNRPGFVVPANTVTGIRWSPAMWKVEGTEKILYELPVGHKGKPKRVGVLGGDDTVGGGEYRQPGLVPEVAKYLYQCVADIWSMDQEFVARWGSWAFTREHRDIKVILAAFLLVQSRFGAAIVEDSEVLFFDEDYRDVAEAMALLRDKAALSPKLLVRVGDVLELPAVAEINRKLGFGRSERTAPMGRYHKLVTRWLQYRETNTPMLEGLVKAGYRNTVRRLAQRVGYRPQSPKFFETLRWRQTQAKDGRRTMSIGVAVKKAESWADLSEIEVCERIIQERPSYKRIVGMLPRGVTRAVMAAAIEAGSLSDADFVILTPTLEDLGLLNIDRVKAVWQEALTRVDNQRAANVARNVRSQETREKLESAAEEVQAKAVEEVTKDLRVYVVVDKSASMSTALAQAKTYLKRFLGSFPLDRTHVSVFNTVGREVTIRSQKAAAVEQAFQGHHAGGGTAYEEGVRVLLKHKPQPGEDVVILFVGDEGQFGGDRVLAEVCMELNPVAFGLLPVESARWGRGCVVRDAAKRLNIPCFEFDADMFEANDPYATTRIIRDLIASVPVGAPAPGARQRQRVSLVTEILDTELLRKPAWA